MRPLDGIRVLDFSTLLPGPLATLILAEAGAEVIKLERPGRGDEMRTYTPKFGDDSVNFALLNRGKKSIAIDLKAEGTAERLRPLIEAADVVVEQFRPGVMDRLGLGYETLKSINPRIIYCAITGYGQTGPKANVAGHDLNFIAEAGMVHLSAGVDGAPVLPPALIADIGGGTYPAVVNILMALHQREKTGLGCKLDIAMSDNLFTFLYWALGNGLSAGRWPEPGGELVTGRSPRYQIYRTADDHFVAAAPIEEKFWKNFCDLIRLPESFRGENCDPDAAKKAVADLIRAKKSEEWNELFKGKDLCCSIVTSIEQALEDPHFKERGLFNHWLVDGNRKICALPVPVAPCFRNRVTESSSPSLGEDNNILE